jgi:hypothetical protein
MNQENNNFYDDDDDELSAENALLKLKLEMQYGMSNLNSSLPPELENEFLKYVSAFEESYKNAKTISVYEFIGKPEFKSYDKLTPAEITSQLESLWLLMDTKGVSFSTICEYEDEVLYRFITEELFQKEIDDMRIPGMMCCFTYEEFYPNHANDLEKHTNEIAENIFNSPFDISFSEYQFADEIILNENAITKELFFQRIIQFQEYHQNLTIKEIKIGDITFDLKSCDAMVKSTITFDIIFHGHSTAQTMTIPVEFSYKYHFDWWVLNGFSTATMKF